jgi:hypothetical protein
MPGFGRSGRPSKPLAVAVGVVILLIAAWVAVARLASRPSDRYESFYPSLADADKDGAITRGWIPDDLLPGSSRAIHELHDLSPSREWCAFEFATDDSQRLRKGLKSIDVLPLSVRSIRNPDVSWWPSVLTGNLDVAKIRSDGFDLYEVERPANSLMTDVLLFAVDWSKRHGFFYSTSKSKEYGGNLCQLLKHRQYAHWLAFIAALEALRHPKTRARVPAPHNLAELRSAGQPRAAVPT